VAGEPEWTTIVTKNTGTDLKIVNDVVIRVDLSGCVGRYLWKYD